MLSLNIFIVAWETFQNYSVLKSVNKIVFLCPENKSSLLFSGCLTIKCHVRNVIILLLSFLVLKLCRITVFARNILLLSCNSAVIGCGGSVRGNGNCNLRKKINRQPVLVSCLWGWEGFRCIKNQSYYSNG